MVKLHKVYPATAMSKSCCKRGFTLIETMISLALLVILVLIISQGFVSTMQLSANTALFEKSGDVAAGKVNVKLASVAVPANPVAAIHLEYGSYKKNIGIISYDVTGTPDTNFGVAAYKETGFAATNRTGFYYCGKKLTT